MRHFENIAQFHEVLEKAPHADESARAGAETRNGMLTKPPGALGRLEALAVWYAAWRGEARPRLEHPQVIVFAGNHGVTARGVSAFPADVTAQMVANFEAGGAAINQLSKAFGAKMKVVPLELNRPTADFTQGPAMSEAEFLHAIQTGWDAVDPGADMLITGEMGIGNTTSAAAVASALYGGAVEEWVGRGTGVSDAGLALKVQVVRDGIMINSNALHDDFGILRCLGGRELAAMAGAVARARTERIPVILDGFICCAAAACLERAVPGALDHAVAGHESEEPGHGKLLEQLGKEPLLRLGMRLGEGSGAALALGVLKGAVVCHSGMATFGEAGVSEG